MKQIIEDIKQQIKEKKAELAKLEAALGKLTGDAVPKAPRTTQASTSKTTSSADSGQAVTPLPDRIIAELAARDEQQADSIAQGLKAPLAQVRSTCSRLAKEGRIGSVKRGREVTYLALKSEAVEETIPFPGETN